MKATDEGKRLSTGELAQLALFCALMVAGKEGLRVIPNVHPVTLLIILCTCLYGRRALYPVAIFVAAEIALYGFGLWNISYIWIWPLQVLTALPFRSERSPLFWGCFAAIHGFAFGGICALTTLAVAGPKVALAFWVACISFDLIHGVSNGILTSVLYSPLMRLLARLTGRR